MEEPRTILVDGYNVIRNTPGLLAAERMGLSVGRDALIAQLRSYYHHKPHRVIVVFDGDGVVETTQPMRGMARSQIIYTRAMETADTVIQRLARSEAAAGAVCVVVSNDLEVSIGSTANGAKAVKVDALARTLNAPDRFQRKQATHRQYLHSEWDRDADDASARRGGNPRRAPRQKRGTTPRDPLR